MTNDSPQGVGPGFEIDEVAYSVEAARQDLLLRGVAAAHALMDRALDFGTSSFGLCYWRQDGFEVWSLSPGDLVREATGVVHCPVGGSVIVELEPDEGADLGRLADMPLDAIVIDADLLPYARALEETELDDDDEEGWERLWASEARELPALLEIVTSIAKLKGLTISRVPSADALRPVLSSLPLESLDVGDGSEHLVAAGVGGCRTLREVRASPITAELVDALRESQLTDLFGSFEPGALAALSKIDHSLLTNLSIQGLKEPLNRIDWERIGALPALKVLRLRPEDGPFDPDGPLVLPDMLPGSFAALEELSWIPGRSQKGFQRRADGHGLEQAPSRLGADRRSVATMSRIPLLRDLYVYAAAKAFAGTHPTGGDPFPSLYRLSVHTDDFGAQDVETIAHPPLGILRHHSQTPIPSEGWALLAEVSTLEDVYSSARVDARSAAEIARSRSLRYLSIVGSRGVGLVGQSTSIQSLKVGSGWSKPFSLTRADDDEVESILECSSLRWLDLYGNFTARSLEVIATAPNIEGLTFRSWWDISVEDKTAFVSKRPDVTVAW